MSDTPVTDFHKAFHTKYAGPGIFKHSHATNTQQAAFKHADSIRKFATENGFKADSQNSFYNPKTKHQLAISIKRNDLGKHTVEARYFS